MAQRQAAQHSGTIARQADRQPARDQLDLGHRLAPEGGVGGDEMAGELAEEEAGLTQRRRDHHGEAALQNCPGGLKRGHCALAALSRRIEQQSRRGREQHIALPGIECQPRDALGPSNRVIEHGGRSGVRAARELRSRASSRLRVAVLMRERRLHTRHRKGGVGELLARARPVDQFAVLDQDDIGGPLEVAPPTF